VPPRFAYWTILAGGLPTAFRAANRDELMPTFQRLRDKHPDAVMKWFARGRLWDSPDDARAEYEKRRQPPDRRRERRGGPGDPGSATKETRGRDWRPGGDHRDPRQKYADAKKARNAAERKKRFERKQGGPPRRDDNRPFETSPKRHRDERPPRHAGDRERPAGPAAGWEKRPHTGPKPRPKVEGERRPFDRPSFARTQHAEKPAAAGRPLRPREASADNPRSKRPGEPSHPTPASRPRERDRRFRR